MEKGYVFCASGHPYFLNAAERAANSIKKFSPDAHITLFSGFSKRPEVFDDIIEADMNPEYRYSAKVYNLINSPYEKTIFLDADTILVDSIDEIFNILNYFDFALPHSFHRSGETSWYAQDSFPGLTGLSSSMIVYRKRKEVLEVLNKWIEEYDTMCSKSPDFGDQGILSKIIYEFGTSLYVLPPEYHFHIGLPSIAHGKIKIFTGEKVDMLNPELLNEINGNLSHRAYIPLERTMHSIFFEDGKKKVSSMRLLDD